MLLSFVRKIAKTFLVLAITLVLVLCVFYAIGILSDEAPLLDHPLREIKSVSEQDNGYLLIAFTQQEGFEFAAQFDDLPDFLESNWQPEKYQKVLEANRQYLRLLKDVVEKPQFDSTGESYSDFPDHGKFGGFQRLAILQSRWYAEQQQLDLALEYAVLALDFAETVKLNRHSSLISHLIGLAFQRRSLEWIHRFVSDYQVGEDRLALLASRLTKLKVYRDDDFAMIFSGEQLFIEAEYSRRYGGGFLKRWQSLQNYLGYGHDEWSTSEIIFHVASLVLPEYFRPKQTLFNALQRRNWFLQQQSLNYCAKVDLSDFDLDENPEAGMWQKLRPGEYLKAELKKEKISHFMDYFERRCLSSSYLNSVQAVVATLRFEANNARQLGSIEELVPEYLSSLPIDSTTGEAILFSKHDRWFYFRGANFIDDGGSQYATYYHQCTRREDCWNNPTVPIIYMGTSR